MRRAIGSVSASSARLWPRLFLRRVVARSEACAASTTVVAAGSLGAASRGCVGVGCIGLQSLRRPPCPSPCHWFEPATALRTAGIGPVAARSRLRALARLRRLPWKDDAEGCPPAFLRRLEDEVATHRPAELAGYEQAETGPLRAGARRASLVALEDAVAVFRADPRAFVRDRDHELARLRPRRHGGVNRRSAAVPRAVVEQRPEDLVELVRVCDRKPTVGVVAEVEGDVGGAERVPGATNPRRQGKDLRRGLQRAGFEARHGDQLADDPVQAVGLLDDDREPRVRPLRAQDLRVRPDARQRRLEVVADPPEELVLRLVKLAELLRLPLHL